MSLNCRVKIVIENSSEKIANMIQETLSPDNINFPKDLSLEIKKDGNKIILDFNTLGNIKRLIATIDEVLEHIQVSLKVIK